MILRRTGFCQLIDPPDVRNRIADDLIWEASGSTPRSCEVRELLWQIVIIIDFSQVVIDKHWCDTLCNQA